MRNLKDIISGETFAAFAYHKPERFSIRYHQTNNRGYYVHDLVKDVPITRYYLAIFHPLGNTITQDLKTQFKNLKL